MLSLKLIVGVILLFLGAVLVYYGIWISNWFFTVPGTISFMIGAFLSSDSFFRNIKGR